MEFPRTGMEKILQRGQQEPDAVRYHCPDPEGGWSQVTWGEVKDRATWIARWLDQQGVGQDTKVAVYANTRVEWTYCCPAIEACRGVFVPVYFSNTADQVQYVVDHSDAQVLFTELALLPRVLQRWADYPRLRRVVVWDLPRNKGALEALVGQQNEVAGADSLSLAQVNGKLLGLEQVYQQGRDLHRSDPEQLERMMARRDEQDLAAIIYTSGTTGQPKGVMLSNRNLLASAMSWHQVLEHAFPPAGERRDILWLPISHMSGWGIMGQGVMFDYETWISDPYQLLGILPEVKPSMLFSVPAYWEKLYTLAVNASPNVQQQRAKLREITGGCLRFLLSGGAGLKREVKEFFRDAGIQMIEGYGLTECAPNLTMNRLDDYDFDSVGKPVPDVEIKLADDGEIMARGNNIYLGYYKDPEATAATMTADGWFCTGDLGQWTDRGFLQIKGRKKEIIVTSAGKNIGPAGIEVLFAGAPLVEHIVLHGDERKYLTALITLNEPAVMAHVKQHELPHADFTEAAASPELRAAVQRSVDAVNAQLASFETIKKFVLHDGHLTVEAGHLTPSLKLRRAKVWETFGALMDALY